MVRPRNALIAAFPHLTPEEASEALRKAGGDLEKAKRAIAAAATSAPQAQNEQSEKKRAGPPSKISSSNAADSKMKKKQPRHLPPSEAADKPAAAAATVGKLPERLPPRSVASVNNLSDRQYCCVWSVEVFPDGYRPDVARALLAAVARHVNPILRERGWRVKRLMESCGRSWIGLCTANARTDADAASVNIQLNLRARPHKRCQQFRSFPQVLSVMLHEITHTKIGLEDIHPPAFWELLDEVRQQYVEKLQNGEVALETDDYGCNETVVTAQGEVKTIQEAARDTMDTSSPLLLTGSQTMEPGDCGAKKRRRWRRRRGGGRGNYRGYSKGYQSNVPKRRPLLKGAKMIDGRTKFAKEAKRLQEKLSPQELAARAALARLGQNPQAQDGDSDESSSSNSEGGESDDDEEAYNVAPHHAQCGCRSCLWERMGV